MTTFKSNFIKDEDYKVTVLPKEQNPNIRDLGGRPEEQVMLNIDTFKNMCMLVKTEKSKEIRKYYVKLENIYNKIIKEEIESKDKLLKEKDILLQDNICDITDITHFCRNYIKIYIIKYNFFIYYL